MKVMKPTAQQRRNIAKSHKTLDGTDAEKKHNIYEEESAFRACQE